MVKANISNKKTTANFSKDELNLRHRLLDIAVQNITTEIETLESVKNTAVSVCEAYTAMVDSALQTGYKFDKISIPVKSPELPLVGDEQKFLNKKQIAILRTGIFNIGIVLEALFNVKDHITNGFAEDSYFVAKDIHNSMCKVFEDAGCGEVPSSIP
jgi:hypothetical protein